LAVILATIATLLIERLLSPGADTGTVALRAVGRLDWPAVVRFLSVAWFDEVNRLLPTVPADIDLVLEQHVSGGPQGDTAYQVRIGSGVVTVGPPAGPADITLVLDYGTAVALATGALSTHDAFLAGRVRLRGNVARLDAAGAALAGLADAMAAVGASTTYEG
jgi:hypothetical protein